MHKNLQVYCAWPEKQINRVWSTNLVAFASTAEMKWWQSWAFVSRNVWASVSLFPHLRSCRNIGSWSCPVENRATPKPLHAPKTIIGTYNNQSLFNITKNYYWLLYDNNLTISLMSPKASLAGSVILRICFTKTHRSKICKISTYA